MLGRALTTESRRRPALIPVEVLKGSQAIPSSKQQLSELTTSLSKNDFGDADRRAQGEGRYTFLPPRVPAIDHLGRAGHVARGVAGQVHRERSKMLPLAEIAPAGGWRGIVRHLPIRRDARQK
jgi:hypothetical protein